MSNTTSSVTVTEVLSHPTVPAKTAWGGVLADQPYFASVKGSAADETFDVADLTARTQALMAAHKRGVTVDMGGGNDTVIGSAYGDTIAAGAGVNYVDGGANQGTAPGGAAALDMLDIYVADAAAAAVFSLDARSSGGDGAAFAGGYKFKVTSGAGETTYVKNVEQVDVRLDSDRSFVKAFSLAIQVQETPLPVDQLATQPHLAWVTGSAMGDIFNAATDISSVTLAKMDAVGRGVFVDTGAGDDRITGSDYGDYIVAGAGINYIDGGANGGSTPLGDAPQDVLQITVDSTAAANAVQVLALAGSTDAADIRAALAGYSYKVVTPGETDYIKGIERVSVAISTGSSLSLVRDILLTVRVQELDAPNMSDYRQIAWVSGTGVADNIDLASGSTLLSDSLAARMAAGRQGAWIDGGGGDDIITGTAYADSIRNGDGNARIDGGANNAAAGLIGKDTFEINVATQADLDAIVVSASDDPLYTWMVTYGAGSTQKDYLRNIEGIYAFAASGGGKWIALSMDVQEASGPDLAGYLFLAWARGTSQDDSFDAAADVSAATLALMDSYGRGVSVDAGAGNDTIKGSAYGDDIYAGEGVNHVDGGANGGLRPWGGKAEDVLRVVVADQAAIDAVQVALLGADTGSAQDIAEFNSGYTHKVVSGGATDYIRNIERVTVQDNNGSVREISLVVSVQEADLAAPDIANYAQVAWVTGTAGTDTINLADGSLLSAPLAAQMAAGKQGISVNGGAGDDVITGSAFSDTFHNGDGNAKIDGGAHAAADNRPARDVFEIAVADQAALDAVQVAPSDDAAYSWMVTYGAGGAQKDYLKNIEGVSVFIADGSVAKWISLTIDIAEVSAADVAGSAHFAWVSGTAGADTFNAATDVSAATRTLMATYGRGVYVDSGAGGDTITGSAFGDHFIAGAGTDYVDGGLNGGTLPYGGRPEDVLQLTVASAEAAAAVQASELSDTGSAADIAAFELGFTHKVVQPAAGGETDYIKGIERISVQVFDGANWLPGRDIALVFAVSEISADSDLTGFRHFAWAYGTAGADKFDPSIDISAATRALMDTHQRGIVVDGAAGSDVITGSQYGDELIGGDGIDYIDGGAQEGTEPGGSGPAQDILRLNVDSMDDMDAAAVTGLFGDGSAADITAFNGGYTHKLTIGTLVTDYFKNIELVAIEKIEAPGFVSARYIAVTPAVTQGGLAAPHATYAPAANVTGADFTFDAFSVTQLGSASTGADPATSGEAYGGSAIDYMAGVEQVAVVLVGVPL
jgi:Ca2+-binding RTX toxin-like protein